MFDSPSATTVTASANSRDLALPTDFGPQSNRDHRTLALQRRVSLLGRHAGLPRCDHLATLPRSVRGRGTKLLLSVVRRLARGDAGTTLPGDPRFGQHRADVLGRQERAEVGYNPKKRGRPSYAYQALVTNLPL